ncbi:hypothetical protein LRQ04_17780 [Paenarthrobacter sp. AR 02]|uniref:hypothetical protein n=1 Tax=Paenarthrobacter sp. AR 02 TaxID=2899821 RepID=UPI001F31FE48|nr:hypothetical protein [Paenarthrobacter sp. AR 02]MCF3141103.1 hypothetical protein [Paenarthrobacter sp. AR 02]
MNSKEPAHQALKEAPDNNGTAAMDPRQSARNLLQREAITLEQLWIKYWAEGGNATPVELDAYVHDALEPHEFELTLIAWAMEGMQGS